MSSTDFYTIGYQGRSLNNLIDVLLSNNVKTVVDVRELPHSRIAGFSKSQLSYNLELAGMHYVSVRQLGSPRELRNEYRRTGNWDVFAQEFNSFLQTRREEIDELTSRVYAEKTCLLCFERDSALCHRSIVAEAVKQHSGNGLRVNNL
jgi:uncharacterized protein (DUF488 family)